MTIHIERLVQQLDSESGESYDARAELIHIGSAATPAILDALPSLEGFGQLTAIRGLRGGRRPPAAAPP